MTGPGTRTIAGATVTPLRTFRTVKGDEVPNGVLTWSSRAQRISVLRQWRNAIFFAFGDQARCVRLAWVLADLFHYARGFAYPSDPFLVKQTGLPLNKLQATLTTLDRGGGIVRVHAISDGKPQRRIYPALPPGSGGGDTPQQLGGQNLEKIPRIRRSRSQLEMALLDAKRREERTTKAPPGEAT